MTNQTIIAIPLSRSVASRIRKQATAAVAFLLWTSVAVALLGCHNESRLINKGDVTLTPTAWARVDARMVARGNRSQVCISIPVGYTDVGERGDDVTISSVKAA